MIHTMLSVAEIDQRGKVFPGCRLGVEDEADCKRLMKKEYYIGSVTVNDNATENRS